MLTPEQEDVLGRFADKLIAAEQAETARIVETEAQRQKDVQNEVFKTQKIAEVATAIAAASEKEREALIAEKKAEVAAIEAAITAFETEERMKKEAAEKAAAIADSQIKQ